MSVQVVFTPTPHEPPGHRCELPSAYDYVIDTIVECNECHYRWTLVYVPDSGDGRSHKDWFREGWFSRRRRLRRELRS